MPALLTVAGLGRSGVAGSLDWLDRRDRRGEHQEPEEAQPAERKRAERNKAVRSELKTRVKAAVRHGAPVRMPTPARKLAQKRLDKAASKGVIHKNQAARRTSRLMKKLAAEQS